MIHFSGFSPSACSSSACPFFHATKETFRPISAFKRKQRAKGKRIFSKAFCFPLGLPKTPINKGFRLALPFKPFIYAAFPLLIGIGFAMGEG
jgi:hypothetical protein